jgi:endoglucanase
MRSLLTQMAALGYPAPYREPDGTYVWGSNGLVANNTAVLALAHDFTGAAKYREGVYEALHYLFGRNPVSYSYISGYGSQPVLHSEWSALLEGLT